MGPAWRQAAQPVPGDLRRAPAGGLLQNGAALPPQRLPPPQAELTLGSSGMRGAALLVPRKAAETEWSAPTRLPRAPRAPPAPVGSGPPHFAFQPNRPQRHQPAAPPSAPTPAPPLLSAPTLEDPRGRAGGEHREVAFETHPTGPQPSPPPEADEPPSGAGGTAKEAGTVPRRTATSPASLPPRTALLAAPPPLAETEATGQKARSAGSPGKPSQQRPRGTRPKMKIRQQEGPREWASLGGRQGSPR